MKYLIRLSEVDINDQKEDYKDAIVNGIITKETDIEDSVNNYIDYLLNRLYHQLHVTYQMINRYIKSIAPQVNKIYRQ